MEKEKSFSFHYNTPNKANLSLTHSVFCCKDQSERSTVVSDGYPITSLYFQYGRRKTKMHILSQEAFKDSLS